MFQWTAFNASLQQQDDEMGLFIFWFVCNQPKWRQRWESDDISEYFCELNVSVDFFPKLQEYWFAVSSLNVEAMQKEQKPNKFAVQVWPHTIRRKWW